jgi:cell division topological specificity factor
MKMARFLKRRRSAPVARERLQVLLAHERAVVGQSDLVAVLREEILAVIAKHVRVDPEMLRLKMERGDSVSTLEVEVDIPTKAQAKSPKKAAAA